MGVGLAPDVMETAPRAKLSVPTDDGSVSVTDTTLSRGFWPNVVEITFAIGGTYIAIFAL